MGRFIHANGLSAGRSPTNDGPDPEARGAAQPPTVVIPRCEAKPSLEGGTTNRLPPCKRSNPTLNESNALHDFF